MTLTTTTGIALILSALIYHGGLAYLLFLLVLSFSPSLTTLTLVSM